VARLTPGADLHFTEAMRMSETNRRKFLAVAGATAAAGTVALTTGGPASAEGASPSLSAAREPVVAYVEDHRGSAVTLMVGEREVVVHDRDLVTRILNAAGGL
jgi:hypothetical protein